MGQYTTPSTRYSESGGLLLSIGTFAAMGFFDILSLPVVASCFLHIARYLSPMAKIPTVFQGEGGPRPHFSSRKWWFLWISLPECCFLMIFSLFSMKNRWKSACQGGSYPWICYFSSISSGNRQNIDQNGHSGRVRARKSSKIDDFTVCEGQNDPGGGVGDPLFNRK